MLNLHGLVTLAACRSTRRDRRLVRLPWTDTLARILDTGVALVTGGRTEARGELGELAGHAEGGRMIAEADAWLIAQGVHAPERLTRCSCPKWRSRLPFRAAREF